MTAKYDDVIAVAPVREDLELHLIRQWSNLPEDPWPDHPFEGWDHPALDANLCRFCNQTEDTGDHNPPPAA